MTFYFRTFRRALSVAMLIISAATVVLAFFMLPSFSHSAIPWLLVAIQVLSFLRTLWSITRKSLLNTSQSVASEAIGLFALFPFHLILALIIATTEFKEKTSPVVVYFLLQTFVISSSTIHILYTTGLIVVVMLTVSAFDGDVWVRDIDSSPSPFPISIILDFLCPRQLKGWRGAQLTSDIPTASPRLVRSPSPPYHGDCRPIKPLESLQPGHMIPEGERTSRSSRTLSQDLIRIPNAAEQRASIAVSFELLGRFN